MSEESLAIIGGTSLLESNLFKGDDFSKILVDTVGGPVVVHQRNDRRLFFLQRHESNPERAYSPPHMIDFPAIASALRVLRVGQVVGFLSVGTLKPQRIAVGDVVIPDDHFCPFRLSSYFAPQSSSDPDFFKSSDSRTQHSCHFVPDLVKSKTRNRLVSIVEKVLGQGVAHPNADGATCQSGKKQEVGLCDDGNDANFQNEGSQSSSMEGKKRKIHSQDVVYATALGPRFETKSEIRFFATYADVIGMTGSYEMSTLQEQGLEFGHICMVDNLANGLESASSPLTLSQFSAAVAANKGFIERVAREVIEHFLGSGDGVDVIN